MRYRQYKFKFYLNASHAIYINGALGQKHPHTWEIVINVLKIQDAFVQFNEIETEMEKAIEVYQNQFLNQIKPFDLINPTLENCCHYFKDIFIKLLNKKGWVLLAIEMSETPSRSYVINLLDEEASEETPSLEVMADAILNQIMLEKRKGDFYSL